MNDYSVFGISTDDTIKDAFFSGPPTIARYDKQRYPWLTKLTKQQTSFFWSPEEIDIYRDANDFKSLLPHEQHIFTCNIKRQIMLDSIQGRAPMLAFGPICSLPELETWLATWTFFETIHSRSYTYLIQNVYSNPSIVFDSIIDIKKIVSCANDISHYYDDLIKLNNQNIYLNGIDETYEHKETLWLALMAVNILEGVRFYISFAASWAFAEVKKMEGNAKIIKLLARDESVHLAGTQQLLRAISRDDPDFARIKKNTTQKCIDMFVSAGEQEKAWAKYMFKDGSIIGLNERIACDYIEWLSDKRMTTLGYLAHYKTQSSNPLPWTQKWISGADVQQAPQEGEITQYVVGNIKQDLTSNAFDGMSL